MPYGCSGSARTPPVLAFVVGGGGGGGNAFNRAGDGSGSGGGGGFPFKGLFLFRFVDRTVAVSDSRKTPPRPLYPTHARWA